MLFENYLNEVEWISSEIEDVIDEITNTEESVALQLDVQTNRILRFELLLSISTFVVTCGALITGLFGMNLLNHMETDSNVFYIVAGVYSAILPSLLIFDTSTSLTHPCNTDLWHTLLTHPIDTPYRHT